MNNVKNKKFHISIIYSLIVVLIISNVVCYVFLINNNEVDANKIYNININSVVEIKAFDDEDTVSYGSAVAIDEDKLITNAHILYYKKNTQIKTFDYVQIRLATENDYTYAVIEKIDYELDLATIIIENKKLNAISICEKEILIADKIYAMGNAQNYGISIMEGIVAQNNVIVEADGKTITAIQCDLNISEGNSGGALLNKYGELIGLTTFRLKDSSNNVVYGISVAIPIKTINKFLLL